MYKIIREKGQWYVFRMTSNTYGMGYKCDNVAQAIEIAYKATNNQ